MLSILLNILYIIFGGVIWRLRGGALAEILGSKLGGTTLDRAATSFLLALPLLCFGNPLIGPIIMLGLFVGLEITGWGPFQGVGLTYPGVTPETTWLSWLPTKLGFQVNSIGYCIVGLAECGFLFVLPMLAGLLAAGIGVHALVLFFMIPFFPIAYLISRIIAFPVIPEFAEGQEWGEIYLGMFLAFVLLLVML